MFHFWRNTLRQGGPTSLTARFSNGTTTKTVNLDTAPSFATMLINEDRDMRELFTAQQDTCPMYSLSTGNITKADCFVNNGASMASPGNNVPAASQAGVLTNPGFLAQYYSNKIRPAKPQRFRGFPSVAEIFRSECRRASTGTYIKSWDRHGIGRAWYDSVAVL